MIPAPENLLVLSMLSICAGVCQSFPMGLVEIGS